MLPTTDVSRIQSIEGLKAALSDLAALERDSRVRSPDFFAGNMKPIEKCHQRIAVELKEIVDFWNWPGLSLLPWEAAMQASDLARACWSEPKFMRGLLPQLEAAFRFGDMPGEWFAKHYDTIMFLENKPQVYGTILDWDLRGELQIADMVEPEKVKFRRDAITMEDLEKYRLRNVEDAARAGLVAPQDVSKFREDRAVWLEKRGWVRRPLSK